MKKLFAALFITLASLSLSMGDAEAARIGGGARCATRAFQSLGSLP